MTESHNITIGQEWMVLDQVYKVVNIADHWVKVEVYDGYNNLIAHSKHISAKNLKQWIYLGESAAAKTLILKLV